MCGICGVIHHDPFSHVDVTALKAMNQRIVHRGPDDEGSYVVRNVGLAMRRLSIIDVHTGKQPVTNENQTIWLVYNGEIYNHLELKARLEATGHRFRSKSDTETIVHLYEEYGEECVLHLRGMFAFALWDSSKRRLFLARDRLGIKPLYYRQSEESFLFASEIKALLAHPGVSAELNRAALPEFLAFGYLAGTRTLFDGIQKLAPGHTAVLEESGKLKIQQYWDPPQETSLESRPTSYYVDGYRDLLKGVVQSHLMSDVPLGVFLSGGIDSSVIAALMSDIRQGPIETFSVGYSEQAYSELPYARLMADHLGSSHHEVRISRKDFFDALPKLIWHEDEPLVWPSSVALYFVARLARERVKVVLTGEGSDETLAGYTRYPFTLWNARLDRGYRGLMPSGLRGLLRNAVTDSDWLPTKITRKLRHTFLARDGASWASFYFDNFYAAFSEAEQVGLLADEMRPTPGQAYRDELNFWEKSSGSLLERLLYTDIKTYLVELCMKQDQMSMAASVESRVPFLDHVLVEFALKIPASLKTRGLTGKRILKTAMKKLLPDSILNRRKMGFPTPYSHWLSGPQVDRVEELLLEGRTLNRGLFKLESVARLFAEHRINYRDHSDKLWRLLNLELWHRVFVDRDPMPLNAPATRNALGCD
ncbi:MAG TPA: asparagine synthase (glutamine-hydrolyzing) [Candidatus Acidoferrum sp.]|nr:asparagine synthase (glutamine-hydrolyzing) [Candidatus Acidoferrum sp.]